MFALNYSAYFGLRLFVPVQKNTPCIEETMFHC